MPSSRLDSVVVSSSSEAQLKRNLFLEQQKRMELEETLNLLLQQQERQETEQYKLDEAGTETRSTKTEVNTIFIFNSFVMNYSIAVFNSSLS